MPRIKKQQVETPAVEEQQVQEPVVDKTPDNSDDDLIAIIGTTVTTKQLNEYKKKYKKVFFTDFAGQYFVWHRLGRNDFTTTYNETEDIEDQSKQADEREKRFFKAAMLYPEGEELEALLDDEILVSRVCDEILYKSGFFRPQTMEL